MGGRASAASKNAWNSRNYDRIVVMVPKGQKAEIRAQAESRGQSINGFICTAINQQLENEKTTR